MVKFAQQKLPTRQLLPTLRYVETIDVCVWLHPSSYGIDPKQNHFGQYHPTHPSIYQHLRMKF
jgi:hypothetical protein